MKSFYSTNYQLWKSVETNPKNYSSAFNRSTEVDNFVITEVFVGDDTRARGYIITNKTTNDFLYFIDVDRVDFKLTSVKIDVNETRTFNNIDELDKYVLTNELDYIEIAEDYIENENNKVPFWGTGYSYGGQGTGPNGDCFQGVYSNYYVFWTNVSGPRQPVMVVSANGNLVHATVPCGTTYQP